MSKIDWKSQCKRKVFLDSNSTFLIISLKITLNPFFLQFHLLTLLLCLWSNSISCHQPRSNSKLLRFLTLADFESSDIKPDKGRVRSSEEL